MKRPIRLRPKKIPGKTRTSGKMRIWRLKTVGKKISKNVFMLYSTNLTAQREDIVRIEWELTSDISVVGTRDEEGRVSLDVKIHKRF